MTSKAHLMLSPSAGLKAGTTAYNAPGVQFDRTIEVTTRGMWPLEGEVVQHLWVSGEDEDVIEQVVADLATLPGEPEPHLHVHGLLTLAVAATRVCGPHPQRVMDLTGQWLEGDETAMALIDQTDDDAITAMAVRHIYMRDGVPWARMYARSDWVPDYRHPLADGTWPTGDNLIALRLVQNVPLALHPQEARKRGAA